MTEKKQSEEKKPDTGKKDSSKAKEKAKETQVPESQKKRFQTAQKYAKKLIEKFKRNVKSVVVYGSVAKGTHTDKSDIDIFVILDDTKIEKEIPPEVKERIRAELIGIAKDVDKNITIQAFMFVTEFWENLREVEPLLIDILRAGIPVFDVGVFMPAKRMLQRGKIPTTREAVEKKILVAPQFIEYAESKMKSVGHYLEQSMAAAGQAPLMLIGRMPPGKEDVPRNLDEYFVKKELLEPKYVKMATDLHKFAKKVEHAKGSELKTLGAEIDKHIKMARAFSKRMEKLVKELDFRRKSSMLMNTYKTFLKADVGALKYKGIEPPKELKNLPVTMYKHFPELKQQHESLFNTLTKNLTLVKKGKVHMIPEREIYELREQTKLFVMSLGKKLKELKDKGEIKPPKVAQASQSKANENPTLNMELSDVPVEEKEKKKD